MPPRNAEATKARILAAAVTEFADHGSAGARVDRIARAADANVRMIYAYYGSKDGLFDAALAEAIRTMTVAVPPTPEDLPGWAGRLFDFHAGQPAVLRINLWAQLERPQAAAQPMESFLAKTAQVAEVASPPLTAVDLLTIIYSVAQAWYLTPLGLLSADGSDPKDPERVAAHRDAVVTAVRRMVERRDEG